MIDEKVFIERLEEEKEIAYADFYEYLMKYELDNDFDEDDDWFYKGLIRAKQIVNQLAEKHKDSYVSRKLFEQIMWERDVAIEQLQELGYGLGQKIEHNNGWIACSERLPEEKENPITHDYMQYPVMVNIGGTLDLRYYYFGNGHWRLGLQVMDKYVTHWMDIAPYQPKGE